MKTLSGRRSIPVTYSSSLFTLLPQCVAELSAGKTESSSVVGICSELQQKTNARTHGISFFQGIYVTKLDHCNRYCGTNERAMDALWIRSLTGYWRRRDSTYE
jgi:hypothetical protein